RRDERDVDGRRGHDGQVSPRDRRRAGLCSRDTQRSVRVARQLAEYVSPELPGAHRVLPRSDGLTRSMWTTAALLVAAVAATSSAQQHDTTMPAMPPGMPMPGSPGKADTASRRAPADSMNMPGMSSNSMPMPIPMPKGMVMMPGLVGLTPPGGTFLPGGGADPASVPQVRPRQILRVKAGDT